MLQQECHLSHPWHDALHHCVPWSDSLFVQTSGSIKNDPQLSQRPSTRSKRQTEVKRQTISQYRCLVFTACSSAGVESDETIRRDRQSLSFPVEWRPQSPKLVQATSKYRYHLIKLRKTIFSGRKEQHREGSFHPAAPCTCRGPRDFAIVATLTTAMPPDSNPGRNLAKRLY